MYFAHSFQKAFVGTHSSQAASSGVSAGVDNGFLISSGIHSVYLKETAAPYALGVGTFGFFNPSTGLSVVEASPEVTGGKKLVLGATSLIPVDKIGPFHGGYSQSNRSKEINPKLITKFFKQARNTPEQMVYHLGNTNLGQDCDAEFLCGKTYTLRTRLWGAPVLSVLNREGYLDLPAYTGCCADPDNPTAIDSTLVFIEWAKLIVESPLMKDFVRPVVFDEAGNPWFATAAEAVAAGWPTTQIWDEYTSPGHTPGDLGGMIITGAYVATEFQTCSFQRWDNVEQEIVQIEAQLLDVDGNPCLTQNLCPQIECCGYKGDGYANPILKEIILHESYLQNFISCDPRTREVTYGTEIINAVPQNVMYTRYAILHEIPYPDHPTGSFSQHSYALWIYIPADQSASFESFMDKWLTAAGSDVTLEEYAHKACAVTALPTPTP